MKIGVFADPHDCSSEVLCQTRRPRLSYEKVRQVMEAFRQNGADYAVCMGDLTVSALCEGGTIPFRILEI